MAPSTAANTAASLSTQANHTDLSAPSPITTPSAATLILVNPIPSSSIISSTVTPTVECVAPSPAAPTANPQAVITTPTSLSNKDIYLLNVAIQGGTNPDALQTDTELRVTNPRAWKPKVTRTGPVDPDSTTGRGNGRKCGGGKRKNLKSGDPAIAAGLAVSGGRSRKRKNVESHYLRGQLFEEEENTSPAGGGP